MGTHFLKLLFCNYSATFEKNIVTKVRTADLNPLFLKISSINSLSQRTKKRTNSKKLNLSGMVGGIDLISNHILDFLENFIEEMS
jgi:hypothetical protein